MAMESLVRRADETVRNHLKAMRLQDKHVSGALHERIQGLWARHGRYACEIVNDCIASGSARGSGFRFDEPTGAALLVTATSLPFPEFTQWMAAESSSGLRDGFGYFASLEDLLRVPEVLGSPFEEFHHWVFSGGKHGLWTVCAVGARAAGRTEFDLGCPPAPILNNHEKTLCIWLGPAPQDGKHNILKCRFSDVTLAPDWACRSCQAINRKERGIGAPNCQKCGWDPPAWELNAGFHDAYTLLVEKHRRSHLLYRHLHPPAWHYVRMITKRDCDGLHGKWFRRSATKNRSLLETFSEDEGRINALATYNMGGCGPVGPDNTVIYLAAFLRLAQTYAILNSISLDEAQSAVFPAIGGMAGQVERMVDRYMEHNRE